MICGKCKVLGYDSGKGMKEKWRCECLNCGKIFIAVRSELLEGRQVSCGCIKEQQKIKNMTSDLFQGTKISSIVSTPVRSASGHKGVYWRDEEKKWIARITFQGKVIILGRYRELNDAIMAREEAEDKYFKPILEDYGEYMEKTRLERNVPGIKWYPDRARWRVRIKKDGHDLTVGWYEKYADALKERRKAEALYQAEQKPRICIICGEKFKLQVRDKHDRKICHSPECRDIWQKYRKSVIDYNRGKRKNEPAIQEFIEKYRKDENNGDK